MLIAEFYKPSNTLFINRTAAPYATSLKTIEKVRIRLF